MFDIGGSELLLIVIVAIVVIGPKDLPRALRLAGQWIAKMRRISGHFRTGIETMIREAELEEMERKWREQNEAIMKAHPPQAGAAADPSAEAALPSPTAGSAAPIGAVPVAEPGPAKQQEQPEPQLPLPPP